MAILTEDRVLVSYEINVRSKTVNILWEDRVLRDGVPFHTQNHRAAYELVNGEIPEHIKQEFHISLHGMGQAALASMTHAKAELEAVVAEKEVEVQTLHEQLGKQEIQVQELVTAVEDLRNQILPLTQETPNEDVT